MPTLSKLPTISVIIFCLYFLSCSFSSIFDGAAKKSFASKIFCIFTLDSSEFLFLSGWLILDSLRKAFLIASSLGLSVLSKPNVSRASFLVMGIIPSPKMNT